MFEMAATLAVCLFVTAIAIVFMAVPFAGIAYSIFQYRDLEFNRAQLIGGIVASLTIGSIFFLIGFSFLGVWAL